MQAKPLSRHREYQLTSRPLADTDTLELRIECLAASWDVVEQDDLFEILAYMIGPTSAREAVLHAIEPPKKVGEQVVTASVFRIPARTGLPAL